jgi:putative oxidoreductase
MSLPRTIRNLARRALGVADHAAFLPPLATRIVLGLGFLQTGWGKWHHFDRTAAFFSNVGIPFPTLNAGVVTILELVGGGALLLGLATRLFASALSLSMTVALLTADRAAFLASWSPAADTSPTDVASFVFLLLLLWLVVSGPGPVSLDRFLRRTALGGAPATARRGRLAEPAHGDGG